ncbi:hypothetical protein PTNB73_09115 [Pyrenophora teres f. teres]|uniref:Uncharacterized protein n=1 Tax=Pyrenophora teres f. teres TaxID=97479 RepID=A0A6S6WE65_9PLEO|nr:hypothetical protein HRS9139_09338 [Pyrenophora teres f. teres]KAE8827359.1 hypothetical protein PTNB85_08712 [Pyrenophora teres f. teres]KAE8831345.1 hypothetical protein HRS9122_08935 [Pyrenophora teres f. teres]KAE8855213.1 hypothetical protein PTNB29_09464 [Pyrenophora teres f. teres]KAE8857867.1 hypothetical protein PTNB73_09115 [Pyrenophora teres f. teres]
MAKVQQHPFLHMLLRFFSRPMPGQWTHRLESCSRPARAFVRSQCRFSSTHSSAHVPGRILRGDDLGPTREDDHQTFRVRKDEQAKQLPLSPFLDPIVLEEKSRFTKPKTKPSPPNFTPFQKRLWENPFAHALATPIRQCRATLILLPTAFMMTLHARPHPETQDPWLLPVSLTTDQKHLGPPFRFVGRHLITAHLGKKKEWEKGIYARMAEKLSAHKLKKMVWREDMADLVLDMLQKKLAAKLSWNFGFPGRLIPVASPRTEDIEAIEDVSCVLMFRSLRTPADDLHVQLNNITAELDKWSSYFAKSFAAKLDPHTALEVTHTPPLWYSGPMVPKLQTRLQFPELHFPTTVWRGRKVAVYSLVDLLGEDKAKAMIASSRYADEACVVIKRARHHVPVEILLMQVQAYVAKPGL